MAAPTARRSTCHASTPTWSSSTWASGSRSPADWRRSRRSARRSRPRSRRAPDGLLLHEQLMYAEEPLHVGMRQYWRDFASLEAWSLTLPHKVWWSGYLRDRGGTSFWHETYFRRGGFESMYVDCRRSARADRVRPGRPAGGPDVLGRARAEADRTAATRPSTGCVHGSIVPREWARRGRSTPRSRDRPRAPADVGHRPAARLLMDLLGFESCSTPVEPRPGTARRHPLRRRRRLSPITSGSTPGSRPAAHPDARRRLTSGGNVGEPEVVIVVRPALSRQRPGSAP